VIFHSLDFLFFFVSTVSVYWMLPHRWQNVLLLVASYFFYGYVHPWFLILIAASTIVDYSAARAMEAWPDRRRRFLMLSIVSNFGMLGFFKYFNFFAENVHAVLTMTGIEVSEPALRIVLPAGISFYTFQAMSYTIDVYRAELRARRSLLDVAVFISFFPHLVAGPIGFATTSTSHSVARVCPGGCGCGTFSRRSCCQGSGMARAGTTCCGASITACC
jgi:D-alanyl-lipoteichoic acid acyltransferase DltB (MBOAT superfamily)